MRRTLAWLLLAASLLALCACARVTEPDEAEQYLLYYPVAELKDVSGRDALVTRSVSVPEDAALTTEELAAYLLEALLAETDDTSVIAPAPTGTTLLSLSVTGGWARVDLSRHYARLGGVDLTLADCCITLTLTQIKNINAVAITSGGRELPYRKTQIFNAADALLSTREDPLRPVTVLLYFYDASLGALRAERQVLALYEGQTRANALLEALLRGPEDDSLTALLPEEFSVLSARVEEGACYLNLPSDVSLGDDAALAVESLVRSLCSLENIERVQFAVDGELVDRLCGVDVSEPLTP